MDSFLAKTEDDKERMKLLASSELKIGSNKELASVLALFNFCSKTLLQSITICLGNRQILPTVSNLACCLEAVQNPSETEKDFNETERRIIEKFLAEDLKLTTLDEMLQILKVLPEETKPFAVKDLLLGDSCWSGSFTQFNQIKVYFSDPLLVSLLKKLTFLPGLKFSESEEVLNLFPLLSAAQVKENRERRKVVYSLLAKNSLDETEKKLLQEKFRKETEGEIKLAKQKAASMFQKIQEDKFRVFVLFEFDETKARVPLYLETLIQNPERKEVLQLGGHSRITMSVERASLKISGTNDGFFLFETCHPFGRVALVQWDTQQILEDDNGSFVFPETVSGTGYTLCGGQVSVDQKGGHATAMSGMRVDDDDLLQRKSQKQKCAPSETKLCDDRLAFLQKVPEEKIDLKEDKCVKCKTNYFSGIFVPCNHPLEFCIQCGSQWKPEWTCIVCKEKGRPLQLYFVVE